MLLIGIFLKPLLPHIDDRGAGGERAGDPNAI
jgi:hypothetical protein